MRVVIAFLVAVFLLTVPLVAQQSDVVQGPIPQAIIYYDFPQPPPASCISYTFTLAEPKDVMPGGRDCCIRDDTIEVSLDGCLVGVINSRPGEYGTHPFTRVGPATALAGTHVVTYCNTVSDTPGPSGWYLDNLTPPPSDGLLPPTYVGACGCLQADVKAAVGDESTYKNHGAYVSAASNAVLGSLWGVSAECKSCIINQFARSVPENEMVSCAGL